MFSEKNVKEKTLEDYKSELYYIELELDARDRCNNCVVEKYLKYSWDELVILKKHCELQIELLKKEG